MNLVIRICVVALFAATVVNGGFGPASTRDTGLTNVNYIFLPNNQSASNPPKFLHIVGGSANATTSSGFYGSLALNIAAASLASPTKTDVAYRLDAPALSNLAFPSGSAMVAVGSESSELYGLAYDLEYSASEQTFSTPTASTDKTFRPYRGGASYFTNGATCTLTMHYASAKLKYKFYQGTTDKQDDEQSTPECDSFATAFPVVVQPDDRDEQSVYVACGDNTKATIYTFNTNSLCETDTLDPLPFPSGLTPTAGAHKYPSLYLGGLAADSSVVIENIGLNSSNVAVNTTRQTVATSGQISSMRVAPDGKNVYAGMTNGTIMVFSRNTVNGSLTYQRSLSTTNNNKVNDIAITADGKLMFALVNNAVIHVFKDDNQTETPALYAPAASAKVSTTLGISVNYPEGASKAFIEFVGSATFTINLQGAAVRSTAGNVTLSINTETIAQSANVSLINTGTSATTIPEGTYTVRFSYQDLVENPAASASSTGVVIDRTTAAISIYSPTVDDNVYTSLSNISLTYYVPEAPTSGSVKLIFTPLVTSPNPITFVLPDTNKANVTLSINPLSPNTASQITSVSANVIPDGSYNITMEYRDFLNNPVKTTVGKRVIIDTITLAPGIPSPTSGSQNTNFLPFTLTLPEVPLPNSVKLFVYNSSAEIGLQLKDFTGSLSFNITGNTNPTSLSNIILTSNAFINITSGIYKFTLSYADKYGNPVANTSVSNVYLNITNNNNNNNNNSNNNNTNNTSPAYIASNLSSSSTSVVLFLCLLFSTLMVLF